MRGLVEPVWVRLFWFPGLVEPIEIRFVIGDPFLWETPRVADFSVRMPGGELL